MSGGSIFNVNFRMKIRSQTSQLTCQGGSVLSVKPGSLLSVNQKQVAKFGPMVESCSTLPSFLLFAFLPKCQIGVLPFYPNGVPARESHPSVASLMSSQSHIAFGQSFNFEDVLLLWLNLDKPKEPITQSIRNRRERGSRFKMMFYVIGSEESKSGSASYSSHQQNRKRGGASSVLPVYRYRVG